MEEEMNEKYELSEKLKEIHLEEKNLDKSDIPGIPITAYERKIKLLEYMDMEISNKEEETYYQKENASYFARMDTDINYNNKMFYKKFYISKDTEVEENERGIYDSSGNYITPSELREMGRESLISVEKNEKPIFKEYEDGTTLIHWSAPLATLYNDEKENSIKINEYIYNTMLKRTFSFNPFKFYNSYIAENEFYKDGTVDEFLIKVLLDKKESNELTDIISTIQGNQNKIIRENSIKSFIVQGCAGSGKTMILLHRLSYLKFNNKLPSYEKIKIITPNHVFTDFIKNLTIDLSIEEIEQMTISDYYILLNNLYLKRYNKIEQIDDKYYARQRDRVKRQFNVENMLDEHLILNNKIFAIYSNKLLNMIEQEYNQLTQSINDEIVKNNLDINEKYPENKTYYEQIIKNIDLDIDKLQKNVDNYKQIIDDVKNKLKDIDELEIKLEEKKERILQEIKSNEKECQILKEEKNTELNSEIKNSSISQHVIQEIQKEINDIEKIGNQLEEEKKYILAEIEKTNKEYEKLRKEKDEELSKRKIFFKKTRNSIIFQQYGEEIQSRMKEINNLKERKFEIEKKQEENILKKNEIKGNIDSLISQRYDEAIESKNKEKDILKESKSEIEGKQEINIVKKNEAISKLEEYNNNKDASNDKIRIYSDIKNKILDNVYFTIDIYENIQSKIREKYNIQIDNKQFLKIDLLIYLYINYIHIGGIINGDSLLCIDEAQDYSIIEYRILNMVNKNIVMNLYGDINQSIYDEGIDDWEDLKEELKCDTYELKENYRNSIEITKYCNKKFNYNILEMGLSIKNVEIINKDKLDELISQKIKDNKSIAIISKEEFKEKINNKLVSYCNVQTAKGMEYNTVIVNDEDMSKNEKYIAYTRALSELYILES